VIAAWQEAYESIPPEKRIRKGEPRPPTKTESEDYLRKKEGLKQLKAREEREIEEAKRDALTVGEKPADPVKQAAAAAPPRATAKAKPAPKKSAEELEAERRSFQIQDDVRSYRLKLNNLQQSAESLEAFIKNTLAREGSECYLRELRQQEMGIYSVDDDVAKLKNAVLVCQSVFRLITEPYVPPAPISRHEVHPSTVTVEM
jgi:Txe/YoeB family toxin of Txe-Axe toxin-antitoxin module